MPTVREAVRDFEAMAALAADGVRAIGEERGAVSSERRRLLSVLANAFLVRLSPHAATPEGLAALDRARGLGLNPGSLLDTLTRERDEATVNLRTAEDLRDRAAEASRAAAAELAACRTGWTRLLDRSVQVEDALAGFDPAFHAAAAVIDPAIRAGASDASIAAPGRLARALDPRLRAASEAMAAYRSPDGLDFATMRDERHLPLVALEARIAEGKRAMLERLGSAESGVAAARSSLSGAEDAVASARVALDAASTALGDPRRALMASLGDWFARQVAAFEGQAALRDPRSADALGRMHAADLLGAPDLALVGHRMSLGLLDAGLARRAERQEATLAKLEAGLSRLRASEAGGGGARFVEIDIAAANKAVSAAAAAIEALLAGSEGRRSARSAQAATDRGASAIPPRGLDAMLPWILGMGSGGDAGAGRRVHASASPDPLDASGMLAGLPAEVFDAAARPGGRGRDRVADAVADGDTDEPVSLLPRLR